ncbi:MAG: prepilin-type N-terminal cleavage/methylation domain-containing protein [Planctomycetota bacterium]
MSGVRPYSTARRGVTLLELLVVIGIMLVLLAVAIPAMQFLPEGRRVREATRSVTVFFGAVRNKAITTGRPVGVILERLERQPQVCAVLREAEVPPAYGGDSEDSMVRPWLQFQWTDPLSGGARHFVRVQVQTYPLNPPLSNLLIRRGDVMQLNYQGAWYTIVDFPGDNSSTDEDFPLDALGFIDFGVGVDNDPPLALDGWVDTHFLTLELDPQGVHAVPWNATAPPVPTQLLTVPFKIYRQPVASSGRVLELSRGAVIDLAASGFDSLLPDWNTEPVAHSFEPDPTSVGTILQPVVVMFFPNGSAQQIYYSRRTYDPTTGNFAGCLYQGRPIAEPIHFLVGIWERIPAQPRAVNQQTPGPWPMDPSQAEDGLHNMHDATNRWVSLNPQTGLVTVALLAADGHDATTNMNVPLGATLAEQLYNGRSMVREAQISEGGR